MDSDATEYSTTVEMDRIWMRLDAVETQVSTFLLFSSKFIHEMNNKR